MNTIKIGTTGDQTAFRPGEKFEATVGWQFDTPPNDIEVRLVWYTQGKGDTDVEIVDSIRHEHPGHNESQRCMFSLPAGPYSFSGKLISLTWALEAIAQPSGDSTRLDITVAPDGREVLLHDNTDE